MSDMPQGRPQDHSPLEPTSGEHSTPGARWDRVNSLFHLALDLDAEARDAFLAKLTADDAALAAEVRSLLAAHQESTGFLATPPGAVLASTASPGDKLGPYRIVEE